jgi:hypothetical protein
MGKTALALNIAEHVALEARRAARVVFSMEMSGTAAQPAPARAAIGQGRRAQAAHRRT